jgi:hypothetical protein
VRWEEPVLSPPRHINDYSDHTACAKGTVVDLAYAPGKPDHVVTPQSARKGAYDWGRDYGFVFLGAGAVLIAVGTVRTRRARRTRRQARLKNRFPRPRPAHLSGSGPAPTDRER